MAARRGPGGDLARSTAAMTGLGAVSRLTGFVRIIVVGAVLQDTFLANTYQSANQFPNLVFELFAAGVLQAVLIPTMVDLVDRGDEARASHVARSVLGLAGAGLAVLAGLGALAAPWLMGLYVGNVEDPAVRADMVRLGTVLLWFFLPQVLMYAAGMVATGVLNAKGRFALPVVAPAVNNVVVTGSYLLFGVLRGDRPLSLDLRPVEVLVLGGGTTLGVVAFCAVPVVAVVRSGFSLRPRFDHADPEVRRIGRLGVWAAALLAGTQVLLFVAALFSNAVEGGFLVYTMAWTFFLLPHALFALPVLTALFPTLSRHAALGDDAAFAGAVASGVRAIAYLTLFATAAFAALAGPLADAFLFDMSPSGVERVARTLVAFAPGLVGYGSFLFLARAFYARGDTRTPALVGAAVVAGAAAGMALTFPAAPDDLQVPALAAAHSLAYLVGAVWLFAVLRRRVTAGSARPVAAALGAGALAAGLAGGAMWGLERVIDAGGRPTALLELVVGGGVGLGVYVGVQQVVGRTSPSRLADLVRGR